MFGAPGLPPRSIVALLRQGLVPALIFSYVRADTVCLKRDEDVPPEQSIASQTVWMDRDQSRRATALGYFT